jgi:hypothetical protein
VSVRRVPPGSKKTAPMLRAPLVALVALGALAAGQELGAQQDLRARFAVVDVYVDSAEPLAAWQFELRERHGAMQVVGVENGDSASFKDAPYYDRSAVAGGRADRIIVASFSLGPQGELPRGRARVATVHVRLTGSSAPDYDLQLVAAGAADGHPIDATISFDTRTGR